MTKKMTLQNLYKIIHGKKDYKYDLASIIKESKK
jgi:hypothetical protein